MTTTKPAVDLEGLYTVSDAAKVMKVDRSTVRRWCDDGLIKYSLRRSTGMPRKVIKGSELIRVWSR